MKAPDLDRLEAKRTYKVGDFSDVALPDLPKLPGMISPAEMRYLYWITSGAYLGMGEVVEVGTWLGRSTSCIAAGLKEADPQRTLWCYDSYEWIEAFNFKAPGEEMGLKPGDDFRPVFQKNVSAVSERIVSTKAAISNISWCGAPIEILILDAPKSRQDITKCLMVFAPYLIPGISVVVLQDYNYSPSYGIPTVIAANRWRMEPVHWITPSSMATFKVTAPFEIRTTPDPDWNFETWENDRIEAAWRSILEEAPEPSRSFLAPGLPFLVYDRGDKQRAMRLAGEMKLNDAGVDRWNFLRKNPYSFNRYRALFEALA